MTLLDEIEALRVKVATLSLQNHGGNYYTTMKRAVIIEQGKKAIITAQTLLSTRILNLSNAA